MLTKTINVAIVDAQTLFRKTLKNFLQTQRNINVVVQAADIHGLLAMLKDAPADLVLMDVVLRDTNILEALKVIKEQYPAIKVLILSMCTDMELLCDLLDSGVYGIISKTDEPEELVHAMLSVAENKIYRSRLFTEVLYWTRQINMNGDAGSDKISLSDREKEILELLWEEKSNKEIARQLFLSVRSIEKIRQDMKEKLGVKSTIGLLKYAINKKIIGISTKPHPKIMSM